MMMNDGNRVYDHEGDNGATSNGGCEALARGMNHPTKLKLTYWKKHYLDLHVSTDLNEMKLCARIDAAELPDNLYVGVTAATGQIHDKHDLISLETRDFVPKVYEDEHKTEKVVKEEPSMHDANSFTMMLLKIVAFITALGVVATVVRSRTSARSAKHF